MRKQVASYVALYLIIQTLWVGTTHACINEAHSLANLQDLIHTFAGTIVNKQHKPAKVGINSCRFARECASFIHVWVYLPTMFV